VWNDGSVSHDARTDGDKERGVDDLRPFCLLVPGDLTPGVDSIFCADIGGVWDVEDGGMYMVTLPLFPRVVGEKLCSVEELAYPLTSFGTTKQWTTVVVVLTMHSKRANRQIEAFNEAIVCC